MCIISDTIIYLLQDGGKVALQLAVGPITTITNDVIMVTMISSDVTKITTITMVTTISSVVTSVAITGVLHCVQRPPPSEPRVDLGQLGGGRGVAHQVHRHRDLDTL